MRDDDDEQDYGDVPRSYRPPQVVYRNGNSSGGSELNKVVWTIAGFLVVLLIALQTFIGNKVWEMSDRLARIETRITLLDK